MSDSNFFYRPTTVLPPTVSPDEGVRDSRTTIDVLGRPAVRPELHPLAQVRPELHPLYTVRPELHRPAAVNAALHRPSSPRVFIPG